VGLRKQAGDAFGAEASAGTATQEANLRLGYAAAGASAALSGLIPIFAKLYVGGADPVVAAGYSNLFAGLIILPLAPKPTFKGNDAKRLLAIALLGAALAPLLYWTGLVRTSGSEAAMLVNAETVFTMIVAVTVLREHAGRREVACVAGIVVGAIVLSTNLGLAFSFEHILGNTLLVAATALWALDNNISTGLSRRHAPAAVAAWKNLVGASLVVVAAAAIGANLALTTPQFLGLFLAGGVGTGVSLTLFYFALRHIGAYRTSAIFGLGGIVGAGAAYFVLSERLSVVQIGGGALMLAAGLTLGLTHRQKANVGEGSTQGT
jgi:drug/metabolite transporter (DMT)-like permease